MTRYSPRYSPRLFHGRTFLLPALLFATFAAPAQTIAGARSLARQGKADAAIAQAHAVTVTSPRSFEAHQLLCLLYRSIDRFDDAIHECEAARDLQPGNSSALLELARTYGVKADHAGPLTGMRMVGRIRESFEKAAELDPKSIEALSDLGEFYVEAPGVVGGGLDRARTVLAQLKPLSAARAHRLAGMIAAKSGDTAAADKEFAAELASGPAPEAYVDLAVYNRKRKQWAAAESNALLAIEKDTAHGPDTIDAAETLLLLKRGLPAAQKGLEDYLGSEQKNLVVPAAHVHTLLGQLLQASGNSPAAQQQFQQALALAASYEPARKALRK